jgi:hypothetical protein
LVEKQSTNWRDLLRAPAARSGVYELPWRTAPPDGPRIARRIAELQPDAAALPWFTGLDISPDGRRLVLVTYGSAGRQYTCEPQEGWREAFARPPQVVPLPGPGEGRRQGEAVCYGPDAVTLYLTSEKKPCPLFVVRPLAKPGPP